MNLVFLDTEIGKFYQRHPEAALLDGAYDLVRGEYEVRWLFVAVCRPCLTDPWDVS